MGHSSSFPFEEFHDRFNYNHETGENDGEYNNWLREYDLSPEDYEYNYSKATEFLDEKYNFDTEYPTFKNGQFLVSDYGLPILMKLANELISKNEPEEIIVLINKILDVTHPRSDLADLFIEGGSETLDKITNSLYT